MYTGNLKSRSSAKLEYSVEKTAALGCQMRYSEELVFC